MSVLFSANLPNSTGDIPLSAAISLNIAPAETNGMFNFSANTFATVVVPLPAVPPIVIIIIFLPHF